jgi:hypothetical protein
MGFLVGLRVGQVGFVEEKNLLPLQEIKLHYPSCWNNERNVINNFVYFAFIFMFSSNIGEVVIQ